MTLDELRDQLAELELPGDTIVVLSKDGEGNGFSPLCEVDTAMYDADSPFSGDRYLTDETARRLANRTSTTPLRTIPSRRCSCGRRTDGPGQRPCRARSFRYCTTTASGPAGTPNPAVIQNWSHWK